MKIHLHIERLVIDGAAHDGEAVRAALTRELSQLFAGAPPALAGMALPSLRAHAPPVPAVPAGTGGYRRIPGQQCCARLARCAGAGSGNLAMKAAVPAHKATVASAHPVALQRRCACAGRGECRSCAKRAASLQRRGNGAAKAAPAGVSDALVSDALGRPGQPLAATTRAAMRQRMGHDFSDVRVHTDTDAAASAQAVGAQAYTVGPDIVFGSGRYRPETRDGARLLAHELAHVAQQRGAARPAAHGALRMTEPNDASEREADRAADGVLDGAARTHALTAQGLRLARQPADGVPDSPAGKTEEPFEVPPNPYAEGVPPPAEQPLGDVTYGSLGRFAATVLRHDAFASKGTHPCSLVATMRVKFVQSDPAAWPAGSFETWLATASRVIAERWSLRYLLAPDGACDQAEPCRRSTVIVHMQPVSGDQHHIVNVRYTKPAGTRSDALDWYESDVRRSGEDLRTSQITANHEFGHLLGLPHVASNSQDCADARADDPTNPEPDICYGRGREERAGIMGAGDVVRVADYAPFLGPMRLATGCPWHVEGTDSEVSGSNGLVTGLLLGGLAGGLAGALVGSLLGPLGAGLGGLIGAGIGALIGGAIGDATD